MTLNDIALSENHEIYIHDLCLSCILNEIGIINSVKDGSWNESPTYNSVLSYFNRLGFSVDITISEDQYAYIPSYMILSGDPVGEPGPPGILVNYKADTMPIYMKLDAFISQHMTNIFGSFGDPTLMKHNKKYTVCCNSPFLSCLSKDTETHHLFINFHRIVSTPTVTKIKYAFTGVYRDLEELCNDLIKFIIIYLLINFVLEEYGNNLQIEFSSIHPSNKYTFVDKSLKMFIPFCSIQKVSSLNYNDLIKYLFNNKQLLKFYKYKLSQL